jgi:hypothetical protein
LLDPEAELPWLLPLSLCFSVKVVQIIIKQLLSRGE